MIIDRRAFLKVTGAGAGVGLIGLTRKSARAAPAKARRLLVLNCGGGLRSTAAFNASTKPELNPWGVLGTFGLLKLGNLLVSAPGEVTHDAPSWQGGTVPDITAAAANFSLLAATDHVPGGYRAGDHTDETPRMGTGYYGKPGAPGLMTVLSRYLSGASAGPVAVIGGCGSLGSATGDWLQYAPVYLEYYGLPPEPPTGGSPTVGRPIEDALDARVRDHRRSLGRGRVDGYLGTKAALRKYGPLLAEKTLRFNSPADYLETLGGVSNRMLLEAVGNLVTDDAPGIEVGRRVAMALRLLQMGSPAVAVETGSPTFDFHEKEDIGAPPVYTRFARFMAGVHFALANMVDENDVPLLESTLVVTTSECSRSAGGATGFNDASGTDHGATDAWRYQGHVLFGAKLTPKVISATDDNNTPGDGGRSTHALLATLCEGLGVPPDAINELWPPGSPLFPEGGPLLDLWG